MASTEAALPQQLRSRTSPLESRVAESEAAPRPMHLPAEVSPAVPTGAMTQGLGGRSEIAAPRAPATGKHLEPYKATSYPPLRNLNFVWETAMFVWSWFTWTVTLPWQIFKMILPESFKATAHTVDDAVLNTGGPIVDTASGLFYYMLSSLDHLIGGVWTEVSGFVARNTKHFWTALEGWLRVVQHKAKIIESEGIGGIWTAFFNTTVDRLA